MPRVRNHGSRASWNLAFPSASGGGAGERNALEKFLKVVFQGNSQLVLAGCHLQRLLQRVVEAPAVLPALCSGQHLVRAQKQLFSFG